jgi:hypothetical protein
VDACECVNCCCCCCGCCCGKPVAVFITDEEAASIIGFCVDSFEVEVVVVSSGAPIIESRFVEDQSTFFGVVEVIF